MTYCPNCGTQVTSGTYCPKCGTRIPLASLDRGIDRMAGFTGKALERGVKATEEVARAAKPVLGKIVKVGKEGVKSAKETTLKAAKKLKEKG